MWVSAAYLAADPPAPPPLPPQPVFRAAPKPKAAPPPAGRAGEPIRDAFIGTCDCPYDRMRNGRRCGNNSAYSKPGGRDPVCYY
jgi:hypothetical protein